MTETTQAPALPPGLFADPAAPTEAELQRDTEWAAVQRAHRAAHPPTEPGRVHPLWEPKADRVLEVARHLDRIADGLADVMGDQWADLADTLYGLADTLRS